MDINEPTDKRIQKFHLEDDEEGKEDQHKQQQAAGVHGEKVVLVGEIRLRNQTT